MATQAPQSPPRTRPAGVAAELAELAGRALPERPWAVRFWDGSELSATAEPAAGTFVVRDPRVLARLVHDPDELGLGRAWVAGELDYEGDVEPVLAARTEVVGRSLSHGDRLRLLRIARRHGALTLRAPAPPVAEARLSGRLHSLGRDRVAVRHHYDVPADFYAQLLGPSMTYSCAYFARTDEPLETAQERKHELVCRKLDLRAGERLLDVGCGWGSLLIHAAREHGAQAVGVTLSEPQATLARERIRAAGVDDRCEVRVADYREVADGPYDKVASIGMYEHVGRGMLGEYAGRLAALVRPGGLVLNHGIARLVPRRQSDRSFIARYVFPDGELHPVSAYIAAAEDAGLEVRDVEALREHYPLTLRRWLANLEGDLDAASAAASEQRVRVWRLYIAGSALAFERGEIGVFQTLAARPGASHQLPLMRAAYTGSP